MAFPQEGPFELHLSVCLSVSCGLVCVTESSNSESISAAESTWLTSAGCPTALAEQRFQSNVLFKAVTAAVAGDRWITGTLGKGQ